MIAINTVTFNLTGEDNPKYGFIMEDGFSKTFVCNWDDIPRDGMGILVKVMASDDYTHKVGDLLDEVRYNYLDMKINGVIFYWEQLAPIFGKYWNE